MNLINFWASTFLMAYLGKKDSREAKNSGTLRFAGIFKGSLLLSRVLDLFYLATKTH